MTHKCSSKCKITNVDGDHYDTSSYMRNRGSQKSEKSVSIEPTETHNSTVQNQLSERKVRLSTPENVMKDKVLSYNYLSEDFESASSSDHSRQTSSDQSRQNPLDPNQESSSHIGKTASHGSNESSNNDHTSCTSIKWQTMSRHNR